jgi:hypothetical protein
MGEKEGMHFFAIHHRVWCICVDELSFPIRTWLIRHFHNCTKLWSSALSPCFPHACHVSPNHMFVPSTFLRPFFVSMWSPTRLVKDAFFEFWKANLQPINARQKMQLLVSVYQTNEKKCCVSKWGLLPYLFEVTKRLNLWKEKITVVEERVVCEGVKGLQDEGKMVDKEQGRKEQKKIESCLQQGVEINVLGGGRGSI